MNITYLCGVAVYAVYRGAIFCALWNLLMEKKRSTLLTYAATICVSLLFGFVAVGPDMFVSMFGTVLYYLALMSAAILLYQGRVYTKVIYSVLCFLTLGMAQVVIMLLLSLLPEKAQWILNNSDKVLSVFSLDFALVCVVGAVEFILAYFMCSLLIRLYKRIRFREEIPKRSWFMFVVMSQVILLNAFILTLYSERQLVMNHAYDIWISLGISAAICIAADVVLFRTLRDMDKKAELELRLKLMEQSQLADYEQYRAIDQMYQQERMFRHDINNKLTSAEALLRDGHTANASVLLQELGAQIASYRGKKYCDNALVNTVLNGKLAYAASVGAAAEVQVQLGELNISQTDLCSAFSNILDNAVEACDRLPPERDRKIALNSHLKNGYLVIQCKNSSTTAAAAATELSDKKAGRPTEKGDKRLHGWGLAILKQLAEAYEGNLSTEFSNDTFSLQLVLKNQKSISSERP